MKLHTLIFDLDGTLIDSQGDILDAIRVACRTVERPIESIDPSLIGLSIRDIARALFGDSFDALFPAFEAAFRISYDDRSHALSHLYPGTIQTLERLTDQGAVLYLATMKPEKPTGMIVAQFGLARFFTRWRSSNSWAGAKLGKSGLVARVIEEERVEKEGAAYVGDHPDDIRAAHAAGLTGIAAMYGYGNKAHIREAKPDITISNIVELVNVFAKGNSNYGKGF